MATPTGPVRRFLAAGAKKASVWRTAVAVGANCGLNCKGITGFVPSRDLIVAEEVDNPLAKAGALNVYKSPEFSVISDMLYSPGALGTLIALLFGKAGTPTVVDTSAYKHTFQWDDSNDGLFATVAVEFPGKIYECPSAKPIEWILKSESGGLVQSELKLKGNKIIDDSTVNGATQLDALTYDERKNYVKFEVQSVKMNDETGGDVAGTTALEVTSVELSYKRQGYDTVNVSGKDDAEEPREGGYPDIRVKLKFPHMNSSNAAYLAKAISETTQKMLIKYTSTVLAGATTEKYSMSLFFPRLRMLCPEASWEEIVSMGIELVAEEAESNPTGMDHKRPYMVLVNKRSTDYLG